jgi:hypothetical protein
LLFFSSVLFEIFTGTRFRLFNGMYIHTKFDILQVSPNSARLIDKYKYLNMYYLSDIADSNEVYFARKKGSRDKKKRQSKLNKFLNGELNPKTGKRNVTLREPVIKRTLGGAAAGTAGASALGAGLAGAIISPYLKDGAVTKREALKYIGKQATTPNNLLLGAGIGTVVGAGLGVGKYLSRKSEINKYNKGKHTVNKYEIKK